MKKIKIVLAILLIVIALIIFMVIKKQQDQKKIMNSVDKALSSKTEKIIYLGRPGCSYCVTYKPILESVTEEYELSFLDINIDDLTSNQLEKVLEKLEIDVGDFGTPTTVIVKNDKVLKSKSGALTEDALISMLEENNVISE